jgi:hypothetical protein
MQAERVILETDDDGRLIGVPELPPRRQVEAIFLLLPPADQETARRTPPAELAGKAIIRGDIVSPILPAEDWNALG